MQVEPRQPMATETMTDAEIVELLATKGLGWVNFSHSYWKVREGVYRYKSDFRPLDDLNAVREIEERLKPKQRRTYLRLMALPEPNDADNWLDCLWPLRHADARTCCLALAEVLGGK